jgi:hypothetical protein
MVIAKSYQVVMATLVCLLAPAELASQQLPGSGRIDWRVRPIGGATAETLSQGIRVVVPKSRRRALALSVAGTLVPVAVGVVVLATRNHGDPIFGQQSNETEDVVAAILIGGGLELGPSLGHFYAHEMGWLVPRVLVGGVIGLKAASQDLVDGFGLAVLGLAAVTVMAARDIATAPSAAQRYNTRRLGLTLGLDRAGAEHRLGLRLGVAVKL